MKKILNIFLFALISIFAVSCGEEKVWETNDIEKTPVYLIDNFTLSTSSGTPEAITQMYIYYEKNVVIINNGSILTAYDFTDYAVESNETTSTLSFKYAKTVEVTSENGDKVEQVITSTVSLVVLLADMSTSTVEVSTDEQTPSTAYYSTIFSETEMYN